MRTAFAVLISYMEAKLQFVGLLLRTTKDVIPRRGGAPTWESPGTMFDSAVFSDGFYQEIATAA